MHFVVFYTDFNQNFRFFLLFGVTFSFWKQTSCQLSWLES